MYIGGSFGYLERPGYPGQGLAHITPNGGIDFTFRSDCWETIAEGPYAGQRIPGVVHTLALDNGILYVGGSFSSIGGVRAKILLLLTQEQIHLHLPHGIATQAYKRGIMGMPIMLRTTEKFCPPRKTLLSVIVSWYLYDSSSYLGIYTKKFLLVKTVHSLEPSSVFENPAFTRLLLNIWSASHIDFFWIPASSGYDGHKVLCGIQEIS
jgi:hypothetical protein